MFPYEIEEALRSAAARTDDAIRRDLEGLPERWARILQEIRRTLYEPTCSVDGARRAAGIGDTAVPSKLGAHLGMPLDRYIKTRRIETARGAVAEGRIPVGLLARALGIRSYHSFESAFEEVTGEKLPVVRAPELLTADFDHYTLRRARQRRLGGEARSLVRHLAETLRRDRFLGVRTTPGVPWTPAAPQVPVVVEGDGDTLRQWYLALAEAQARFRRDADLLPARLTGAFYKIADSFYRPDFSAQRCCQDAGVRDTSVTSQVRCYLGDPISAYVEKRRVTMAARLLALTRLKVDEVAEAVGMGQEGLRQACKRRTGERPSALKRPVHDPADVADDDDWRRAGLGELSRTEARLLAANLHGLCPEAFDASDLDAWFADDVSEVPSLLAVRHDVDPARVDVVVTLAAPAKDEPRRLLDEVLRTHPDYAGAAWYLRWIGQRLKAADESVAWERCRRANRDLADLLGLTPERREAAVRASRSLQSAAFIWVLVDAVEARRPHDPAESAHFVDLALAAAEERYARDSTSESKELLDLCTALRGNVDRMRNGLDAAGSRLLAIDASAIGDDWIRGRVLALRASYFERRGLVSEALTTLLEASQGFKRARDEVERCRCVIQRAIVFSSGGINPCRLLTASIRRLDRFKSGMAAALRECAHTNRLLSGLYHLDRLTGKELETLERWRQEFPPEPALAAKIDLLRVDGILAHFRGRSEMGAAKLLKAARWYEDNELLADSAVAYLELALIEMRSAPSRASAIARLACDYLEASKVGSHSLHLAAQVCRNPTPESLRRLILVIAGAARSSGPCRDRALATSRSDLEEALRQT